MAERIEAERDGATGRTGTCPTWPGAVGLTAAQLEALATADAFAALAGGAGSMTRREALWAAGAAAQERPTGCPARSPGSGRPTLPGMDEVDGDGGRRLGHRALPGHATRSQFVRDAPDELGAVPIAGLPTVRAGRRVLVGGIVTHRQRPATAGGITFLNLEDETGMLNVICSPGLWQRFRRVARTATRWWSGAGWSGSRG